MSATIVASTTMVSMDDAITEHTVELDSRDRHRAFYRSSGPGDGTPIVFVHGWPELSLSWRHQLRDLGARGYRCIAPDQRGYGRSTVYDRVEDYAIEELVADQLALADELGIERAVWVGHDWGSPVVWSIAAHQPERCLAVANLCVPYRTLELGLDAIIELVDRDLYPADQFPAGQWEYMRYYEENFADATAAFDANPRNLVQLLFRSGDPSGAGQPAATAFTRINEGWFGSLGEAPEFPRDDDVVSEAELDEYATHLERNGFFGPDAYYVNHERNAAFAATAAGDGILHMPVLFLGAAYDFICLTDGTELGTPMREHCRDLTERLIESGHWMAQERPQEVSDAIADWLADRLPSE